METVTVPESVCIDGEWFAAHWQLQAVDGGSGELLITVSLPAAMAGRDVVLRMDMESAQYLRRQAGIEKPLPVDEARGELAYLRECAQYAADMLARGWTAGQSWRQVANNAESYLRQTLALDAEQEQTYDVPHECNGVRFAELEREAGIQKQRLNALGKRMDAMEKAQRVEHRTMHATFNEHQARLDALAKDMDALEYTVRNLQRLAQSDHGPEAGL